MDAGIFNIGLAFIEGFALIISPCILPILPIILSGSLAGSKMRPLGIIAGFVMTFTLVTLFTRTLVQLTHINPETLRDASYVLLILLGVMMMSTYLTEKFDLFTSRLTSFGSDISTANHPQSGFGGGMIFGALIGIIWTPCAGPILAAVIVQSIIQTTTINSVFTVLAFAAGAGLPMLMIALIGRRMIEKLSFFRGKTVLMRKVLGLLIIASVVFFIYYTNLTLSFAQAAAPTTSMNSTSLINGVAKPYPAPAIATDDIWVNSPALTLSQLKGKVVLIDFWTYSCINCIRTLPYIKNWYAKYHDKGLEIIGIHAPEFEFERNIDNVKRAIASNGIHYPVAMDNQYSTWNNYQNHYWPAHYLIDKDSNVVYEHFGEGEYDVTENNIRYLLGLTGSTNESITQQYQSSDITPETYLGYLRANSFSSPEGMIKDAQATYHYPSSVPLNSWALNGEWTINAEKIVANSAGASIKLNYYAGSVYAVMGVALQPIQVRITVNGKDVVNEKVSDVTDGKLTVKNHELYTLINMNKADSSVVEITALQSGLEIYAFTFGM